MTTTESTRRLQKLFAVDSIRLGKLGEIVQYTIVFTMIALVASKLLHRFMFVSKPEHTKKKGSLFKSVLFLLWNLTLVTFVFFYIRKIGLLVPSLPSFFSSDFKPYTTLEYTVHIAIVVLFIELLPRFKHQIEIINEIIHH